MLAEYIYLGDQLLTMLKPGEVAYYYHNDHLGTPQVLTNDTQGIAWKAAYTPFGEAVVSIATVENPFRFPGQYYDPETGLHYNYFRYYNPQTGRYITPDPIGLWGGINLFTYVRGNPLRWIDPEGLRYAEQYAAYGAIIGGTLVAAGSVVADVGTFGANIVATPAEIAAGAALGGAFGYAIGNLIDQNILMSKESRKSDKERSTEVPSWAASYPRKPGESCGEYAERILKEKYGCEDERAKKRGPRSEYSQIKKHCERGN
jgi:RHS repeat-associated protein